MLGLNKLKNRNRRIIKENKYLDHFQLFDYFIQGTLLMIYVNPIILLICLFMGKYPKTLATIDIYCVIFDFLLIFVFRPLAKKGEIKAYYRRDYNGLSYMMLGFSPFLQGAMVRFPFLALYLINIRSRNIEKYHLLLKEVFFNPVALICIVAFVLFVYILFYNDKYVTVKEFSVGVTELFHSYSYNEKEACKEFISRKESRGQINKIFSVQTNNQYVSENNTAVDKSSKEEYSEPVINDNIVNVFSSNNDEIVTVRRQSRRR